MDTVNTEEVLASVELPPKSDVLKADRALPQVVTVPSLHLNLIIFDNQILSITNGPVFPPAFYSTHSLPLSSSINLHTPAAASRAIVGLLFS